MRLKSVRIKNFRVLEDIEVEFENRVNVIVGPNAIGKTTVLEAIRLAKSILAPRTSNESTQVLFALGASVPYNPTHFIPEAIARDPGRQIEIRCQYELTPDEFELIDKAIPKIATEDVLRMAGQGFQNPSVAVALLSSAQGQASLKAAEEALRRGLAALRSRTQNCRLDLTVDPASGRFDGGDPLGARFVAFLDSRLSPALTNFSYFPADRALPLGEQPVQLGIADANTQLEAHMSQPQLKYGRLKNTIFNAVITSESEHAELKKEFQRIFNGILKGRELAGVGVNQHGLLSIDVRDLETGRTFALDSMSSGEKGLILTFLLIGRSSVDGGIVLLDEPELHLNPAVCRHLLGFLVEEYAVRKNLQILICSHSPEILAGTFDKADCGLYHLVSEKLLTPVRRKDNDEISEALSKLGTSEGEGLLYKATIFVEGDEDVELLETGFADLLRRHKLKDLGGRNEVEKQIVRLQEAEARGERLSPVLPQLEMEKAFVR